MELKKAERKRVKLRLNIASPSGYGKTYSALLIAYGITKNWKSIAVIDSENDSASLYAYLGEYQTLLLAPPFTPDRYIQAIKVCEDAGMEVIIIDSITHVWKGAGGILEYQNALGGRYQDWAKATPLYQKWLNAILQSKCHVITTNRKKQGYNMITEGNKTKVEKAGLDDEIRDGYEYEMTISLEIINDKHMAKASKDRTGLFSGKPEFIITSDTGKQILQWCNQGAEYSRVFDDNNSSGLEAIHQQIQKCTSLTQLVSLYNSQHEDIKRQLATSFTGKKQQLITIQPNQLSNTFKISTNGTHT